MAAARSATSERPVCGLVIPISATPSHSEIHWKDVLKLLHRYISNAGFQPQNVWESSSSDRISERIVGNLFNFPMAVCDISDLNPNVMFELGLRLSSKKPTIIVCNSGSTIPFDIRDFEAIFYPSDLNILQMEDFSAKLDKSLKDKFDRFSKDNYTPFLSTVIVDVASPQTREVEMSDLILSRLDDLNRKISSIELINSNPMTPRFRAPFIEQGVIYIDIPEDKSADFIARATELVDVDDIEEIAKRDGLQELKVLYSSGSASNSERRILKIAKSLGGEEGIPF